MNVQVETLLRVFLVAVVVALLFVIIMPAKAHMAQSGWVYPAGCCSQEDCHEIDRDTVQPTKRGYVLKGTAEMIPYMDQRIRESGDEEYHQCKGDSETICFFVPNLGT